MSLSEIILILLLCILLLKPKDIQNIIKNISTLIININKYINIFKEQIIKTIDTDDKNKLN